MSDKPEQEYFCNEDDYPYIISAYIMELFCSTNNFAELMGLFVFYCRIARKQKTTKVYANTEYVRKNLGWGRDKIRKTRKMLLQLGVIAETHKRDDTGKIKQSYVQLIFKWHESLPQESPSKKSSPEDTNTQKKISKEKQLQKIADELKKRYWPLSKKLAEIVMDNRDVLINPSQIKEWAKQIRLLSRTSKITIARIEKALDWYKNHIKDPYIPVIQSGKSFREKFLQLESAMERGASQHNLKKNPQSQHENLSQEEANLYNK